MTHKYKKETTTTSDLDVQVEMAYRSGRLYHLLANVFMFEPSVTFLDELISNAINIQKSDCMCQGEFSVLHSFRVFSNEDLGALRNTVAAEYAKLFIGPRKPIAPLYESVYRGASKRLFDDITLQVRGHYLRHGFRVIKAHKIPDDHISYELEFMAQLCERGSEHALTGDNALFNDIRDAQVSFLDQHLRLWVVDFAKRIIDFSGSSYYAIWANYLVEFIREECDLLMIGQVAQ